MKFQQIWSKYGKSIVFPAVVIVGVIFYFTFNQSNEETSQQMSLLTPVEQPEAIAAVEQSETEATGEQSVPEAVIVDVKGAVKYPGIVQLTTEDRVMDAIEAAGGYTELANPITINHAQKLVDEMVIYVPQQGENVEEVPVQSTVMTASGANANDDGKVNINTATESELTTLPGIGPSKAAAIISYREENGGFKAIEDLKNVSGIGDKTFEKLQHSIKVK